MFKVSALIKCNVEKQKYEKREGTRKEKFVRPETRTSNRLYVNHV